jgi:HSP20 family protein
MPRQSLTPFGGSDPILSLHREMNRLFDDMFGGSRSFAPISRSATPAMFDTKMDVSETDKAVKVCVDLPGVAESDIDVSLDDDMLTIRGEKKLEQERGGEKENFHVVERSYGAFQRSLRLPFKAKPEDVRARFENGVLTVTVPKTTEQASAHRIQIQGAAGATDGGRTDGGRTDGGRTDGGQAASGQAGGAATEGGAPQTVSGGPAG